MGRMTFQVPAEIADIVSRHSEVQWDKIVLNTLWQYGRKIEFMDRITVNSKLTKQEAKNLDELIKGTLLKRYRWRPD